MRTKTTKQAEIMTLEKMSDFALISGPARILWQRHSGLFWIFGFWTLLATLIWVKLGE